MVIWSKEFEFYLFRKRLVDYIHAPNILHQEKPSTFKNDSKTSSFIIFMFPQLLQQCTLLLSIAAFVECIKCSHEVKLEHFFIILIIVVIVSFQT